MLDFLPQLAPIFFFFAIGVALNKASIADINHGGFLLRLVIFVTLPLLILRSISQAELGVEKALLPLTNIGVNLVCMLVMLLVLRFQQLPRDTSGSMVMSSMISNNAFMFPFILTFFGESGFADAILYDFGNSIMVATITYAMACRYGGLVNNNWDMLIKVFRTPLFWSLVVAVCLSVTGAGLPQGIGNMISPVADMTSPLILIALGIHFSFHIQDVRLVALAVFIRMGLGLLVGIGLAKIFGFEGQTFVVVSVLAGAPIGFMALTFSSLAKLDSKITASAVSFSIVLGLFYIPLLIWFFN